MTSGGLRLPAAFLAAFFLVLPPAPGLVAQDADRVRIEIHVVDASTGEPLPDASLELGDRGPTSDDGEGGYVFADQPLGEYRLVISAEGYETLSGDFTVDRPGEIALALRPVSRRGSRARLVGRVVDRETGRPIPDVEVRLLEAGETRVTDARGRFDFGRSSPGTYRLEVERLGYRTTTQAIDVGAGEAVNAVLSISPDPVPMEGIDVAVEPRTLPLQEAGFYDREEVGLGEFLGPEEIEERRAFRTTDLLQDVPGVRIVASPQYPNMYVPAVMLRGGYSGSFGSCGPVLYIDGVRMPGAESDGPLLLDQYVDASAIVGVEVYRSSVEVPPQFNATGARCGVLAIWTGASAARER